MIEISVWNGRYRNVQYFRYSSRVLSSLSIGSYKHTGEEDWPNLTCIPFTLKSNCQGAPNRGFRFTRLTELDSFYTQ